MTPPACVAVCRRVNRAAIAVVGHDGILDILRCSFPRGAERAVLERAVGLAFDYEARPLIVEPGLFSAELLAQAAVPVVEVALATAKAHLCGDRTAKHPALIRAVLARHPAATRLVEGAHIEGPTAYLDRWRTVLVFAIGLGMAHLATTTSTNSP